MTFIDNSSHLRTPDPTLLQQDPFGLGLAFTTLPGEANNVHAWPSANWCVYQRVVSGGGTPITKIRLHIGVSSGNLAVAVYENIGTGLSAQPGGRLLTSGSVASPGTGAQDIALGGSVLLVPGQHWVAIAVDNATLTLACANNQTLTSSLWNGFCCYQTAAEPPPALAAPTAAGAVILSPLWVGVP